MKRIFAMLLCLLLLSACGTPAVETPAPAEPDPVTEVVTEPEPAPEPEPMPEPEPDPLEDLRKNLPVMDGSTSLIPLETGIRAALFGLSQEEAAAQVAHSSTWQSFYNLLDGRAELVFSCPLSADQWEIAAQQGVELETVAVAREGFVFVVNGDNPVDTLTQEQLRAIYSGEIINWNQVGGPDLPIIAYQRNNDSGSQNYMIEFMGSTPLMDAPMEQRPATMEGLMDVIAVNDNAAGAIGYSVYAYAADMYGSGDEIKFIAVDGVAPDKQTMASGEYPLLGNNYAVFRADEPADSYVRQLVDWMTSYEGQLAIAGAGYVTMTDIGYDYEEMVLRKYTGTGTGGAAQPLTVSYEYVGAMTEGEETITSAYLPLEPVTENGLQTYRVRFLKDEALQREINQCIDGYMTEAVASVETFRQMLDRRNSNTEWSICEEGNWDFYYAWKEGWPASAIVTVKNGWLSLAVTQTYTYTTMDGELYYDRTWTAVWDLLTGQQVEPEALFYDGVDIAALLNDHIRTVSQEPISTWGTYYDMKCDFAGLTETGWHLTADAVYIDGDNPYFSEGVRISLDTLDENAMVTGQPRDFSQCLVESEVAMESLRAYAPGKTIYRYQAAQQFRTTDRTFSYQYTADGLLSWAYLPADSYPGAAAIYETVERYLETFYTREAIVSHFTAQGAKEEDVELWMLDWRATDLGGRYLRYYGYRPEWWSGSEENLYPYGSFHLFDLQTGRELAWYEILADGWQDHVTAEDPLPDRPLTELECENMWTYGVGYYRFRLWDPDTEQRYGILVPISQIIW